MKFGVVCLVVGLLFVYSGVKEERDFPTGGLSPSLFMGLLLAIVSVILIIVVWSAPPLAGTVNPVP
jgi:hypothetical protein